MGTVADIALLRDVFAYARANGWKRVEPHPASWPEWGHPDRSKPAVYVNYFNHDDGGPLDDFRLIAYFYQHGHVRPHRNVEIPTGSAREAVDLLVALGVLPHTFSSSYAERDAEVEQLEIDLGNTQQNLEYLGDERDAYKRQIERLKSIADQRFNAVAALSAELAKARLTTVWWAYDDSEGDAWEANAIFADEQAALTYALDAWVKAERNRCADHDDEPADDCEDCQQYAAYVARLEWRKVANRWELWDKGGGDSGHGWEWKPGWSGVTVAPNALHWPPAPSTEEPS